MSGDLFFRELNEADPLRQGDVLARGEDVAANDGHQLPKWGIILTADCDLEHSKSDNMLTYLGIITAQEYVEHNWASSELEKLRIRYAQAAINHIRDADTERDPNVRPLTESELLEWIGQDSVAKILDAVGLKKPTQRKAASEALDIFSLCHEPAGRFETPLSCLKACWTRLGRHENEQKKLVHAPLRLNQMRSDCFFVPTLPSELEIGFVILLRDIRSIEMHNVFRNRLEMRLNDATVGLYRVGRFADFIRYAIAQQLAFLFSRIGMTSHFEEESLQAADLVGEAIVEKLVSKHK